MPSQRIQLTDPETGKTITLDWNGTAPPTPAEQAAVFAEAKRMREGPLKVNLSNPFGQNMTGGDPGEYVSNQDLLNLGGETLKLVGGVGAAMGTGGMSIPAQLAIQTGADTALGGISGWMKGEDPIKEAVSNGLWTLLPGAAGAAAPKAFNQLAQLFGGKYKNTAEDAAAFARYRKTAHEQGRKFGGIPVGGKKATKEALKEQGQVVKHAELANPTRLSIEDTLAGSQNDLLAKAVDSVYPEKEMGAISQRLSDHITSQQRVRGGYVPDPDNILDLQGTLEDSTQALSPYVRRRTPGPVRNVKDAEVVDDIIDVTPTNGKTFRTRDDVSIREAGNLKRAASERSDDVIRARKKGEMIPASEKASSQFDANLGNAWRGAIKDVDTSGDIGRANAILSDLKRMDATNEAMRNPWSPGAITARAAVGGGLASAISATTGVPFLDVLPLLSGIGVLSSPSNISRTGYGLDYAGKVAPHFSRGVRFSESLDNVSEKEAESRKRVKRREPK